jgi:hypothetical protein
MPLQAAKSGRLCKNSSTVHTGAVRQYSVVGRSFAKPLWLVIPAAAYNNASLKETGEMLLLVMLVASLLIFYAY